MKLRKAKATDLDCILTLYTEAIGREGCVWDEEYPGANFLRSDLAAGDLYVLEDGGEIIGAVSLEQEREYDDLADFAITDETEREIARVVIAKEHSGKGLAAKMLQMLFDTLKAEGLRGIRLSVASCNEAAMRTYKKLGFVFLAPAKLYGGDYWLCERIL